MLCIPRPPQGLRFSSAQAAFRKTDHICTGFLHPFMVTQLPRWKKTCGRWWWLISWFTCALRSFAGLRFGSTIIPHLSLIDDVSSLKLSENTVLNPYADDMLLYKQIKCSEDYQQLQFDIDKISSWVNSNHLSLNPAKCKTMLLSRKRNLSYPPQFLLNMVPLEQVETFKYLGVLISSDLSWSKHVDSICAKERNLLVYYIEDSHLTYAVKDY